MQFYCTRSFGYAAVAHPEFLYPGRLPPRVPNRGAHPVPKLDGSPRWDASAGPRPPRPRVGEEDRPLLPPPPPRPRSGHFCGRISPHTPGPFRSPRPGTIRVLAASSHPVPSAARLAAGESGRGPSASRAAHLLRTPQRPPAARTPSPDPPPSPTSSSSGYPTWRRDTAEQETGPRSLSCAGEAPSPVGGWRRKECPLRCRREREEGRSPPAALPPPPPPRLTPSGPGKEVEGAKEALFALPAVKGRCRRRRDPCAAPGAAAQIWPPRCQPRGEEKRRKTGRGENPAAETQVHSHLR